MSTGLPCTSHAVASGQPSAGALDASAAGDVGTSSYRTILRASSLIAGSSAAGLAIGLVRTKVMAVLLGPAGLGLMGIYTSIADLVRTLAEMGIQNSGVRQIADAVGAGDDERVVVTVAVLRRVALGLGAIGALILVTLARPISVLTFGSDAQTWAVALLSLAVFARLVADGQAALLQGMRRIGDIARCAVASALAATLSAIAVVLVMGVEGVAAALVAVAVAGALVSWWFVRRVPLPAAIPALDAAQLRAQIAPLLGLGLAFMASGLVTMGTAYVVRMLVIRHEGLDAAGLYQSAWTVGGLYVGFVLQAMGTDFYPRLVAACQNNGQACRLVNEQAHVSLLLAGCGVLGTLTFAPWIVTALYSGEFRAASELLRWIVMGMAMRVISWPLGYILVAKGARIMFVATDLVWASANVVLTAVGLRLFGLPGVGMAFLAAYALHLAIVYPLARRLVGFRWSGANLRAGASFVGAAIVVFAALQWLQPPLAMGVGALACVVSAMHALWVLRTLVGTDALPPGAARLVRAAGGTP